MVTLCEPLKKGVRFKCLVPDQCDGHCCWGDGTIYIFEDDIARLADHFGLDIDGFIDTWTKAEQIPCVYHKNQDPVPVLSIKEQEGNRGCVFLDERGLCKVYLSRPFQCIGYPFWKMFTRSDAGWQKLLDACPGARQANEFPDATLYKPTTIKRLVKQELAMDKAWEDAMLEWKRDYRAYLRSRVHRKKKK